MVECPLCSAPIDVDEEELDEGEPLICEQCGANLVVASTSAYAEDGWEQIRVGDVHLDVAWACSRCVLTTVDPGAAARREDGEPMKTLRRYRKRDGAVYFGQNLLPRDAGVIGLHDSVEISDGVPTE